MAEDSIEIYDPKKKEWEVSSKYLMWRREDGRGVVIPGSWYSNCLR